MAGALVGGAFLSAFLQVLFDRIASREVLSFFKGRKLNDRLLQELQIAMTSVEGVLDDAEEKQITRSAVKKWLDELKHAVYEADDLLDEISFEALRSKLEAESQSITDEERRAFSSLKPTQKDMKEKLEAIRHKLEYLVKQKDALRLREGIGEKPSPHKIPTTSLVDESGVYGREDDRGAIMKLLLSDDANGNNLGVIPIVGMGGVGKTTLAQIVYNNSSVQEWFELRAWVCVSEEFDLFKVTKDILKGVTPVPCDTKTPDQLQLELKERLMGKKFLFVLDDVWNEKYADWDILMTPLKFGARGSKIIVTTRNESVASIMRTVPSHQLEELTDDDCWALFAKHAFGGEKFSAYSHLEDTGREIVRKCKGLPLAAKTLGGLLRTKRKAEEWQMVLESSLWDSLNDDVLPALRLSYHYLPSPLKRCFAYCAIFPKDYEFEKKELVRLWMAEGFLVPAEGKKEMEEVGDEYFCDLVSRSFFQRSADESSFIMHDLMHDLAKLVSGKFCLRSEGDDSSKIGKMTRHLSCATTHAAAALANCQDIYEAQFVRTLLCVDQSRPWEHKHVDNDVMRKLLQNLRRLRVLCLLGWKEVDQLLNLIVNLKHLRYLDLSFSSTSYLPKIVGSWYYLQTLNLRGCREFVELPDSIGNVKHLRYLDLSQTSIERLPESVSNLRNLQTLLLEDCENLVELPTELRRLINLCQLCIGGTKLQQMPAQMSKLTKLQQLTDFILGDRSGSSVDELGELQHLKGALAILNLQNVKDVRHASRANLRGKKELKRVELIWRGDTEDSQHARRVLEQLQPHTNMESLSIVGYGSTTFPHWVEDLTTFSNLVSLKLCGFKYCTSLPPLGQLESLKDLSIAEFDAVVKLGLEFYGNCTPIKKPFPSLEILMFERMPEWSEWVSDVDQKEGEAFPLLQELCIIKCPNLIKALPSHLPSLSILVIRECHQQLVISLPRVPTIQYMELKSNGCGAMIEKLSPGMHVLTVEKWLSQDFVPEGMIEPMGIASTIEQIEIKEYNSLKCFPMESFPRLKNLYIRECPNFESLSSQDSSHEDFASLNWLNISSCPSFVSFPKGGLRAPNLIYLTLSDCSNLMWLPECMHSLLPSLVKLNIRGCPKVESLPEGGLPSKLEELDTDRCDKLTAGPMQWDLRALRSLLKFSIRENKEVVELFLEETLLPSTLTSLEIFDLPNLKYVNHNGLRRLTSLRKLLIRNCPKLQFQSIPEEWLHSSLTSLEISGLKDLESLVMMGIQNLTSLQELAISDCPMLQSVPEEGLPSTLTTLNIRNMKNLKFLNHKGLQQLTSLRNLYIGDCPVIQCMPEEGLPSSLSSLIIRYCPLLKERCEPEKREDWPKISHIPNIQIN